MNGHQGCSGMGGAIALGDENKNDGDQGKFGRQFARQHFGRGSHEKQHTGHDGQDDFGKSGSSSTFISNPSKLSG